MTGMVPSNFSLPVRTSVIPSAALPCWPSFLFSGAKIMREGREKWFNVVSCYNYRFKDEKISNVDFSWYFVSVHDPEDAVVHLAVRLRILPEILAEVACPTGDFDMWASKNMLRAGTRRHTDIKSRWIRTCKIPYYFIQLCLLCYH